MTSYFLTKLKKYALKETVRYMPPEVDVDVYQALYEDLAGLEEEQLLDHFNRTGKAQGRRANDLISRQDFAALITPNMKALEIGPFASPVLQGPNITYCDVLNQEELRRRAIDFDPQLGFDAAKVPFIKYVLGAQFLDGIPETFDALLSSHAIEHQPDLVNHLQQVQRRITDNDGRYFILIPDKRYCFDRYIPASSIAEVVLAHHEKRLVNTLRSVIEHHALTVHNDSLLHWNTPDQPAPAVQADKVRNGIREWEEAKGGYVDVHAWYFTPDSFVGIVELLNQLNLISLVVERVYDTRYGANEFWVILKKKAI